MPKRAPLTPPEKTDAVVSAATTEHLVMLRNALFFAAKVTNAIDEQLTHANVDTQSLMTKRSDNVFNRGYLLLQTFGLGYLVYPEEQSLIRQVIPVSLPHTAPGIAIEAQITVEKPAPSPSLTALEMRSQYPLREIAFSVRGSDPVNGGEGAYNFMILSAKRDGHLVLDTDALKRMFAFLDSGRPDEISFNGGSLDLEMQGKDQLVLIGKGIRWGNGLRVVLDELRIEGEVESGQLRTVVAHGTAADSKNQEALGHLKIDFVTSPHHPTDLKVTWEK